MNTSRSDPFCLNKSNPRKTLRISRVIGAQTFALDERLLHGVQRFETNWSKIVSTYLPNRTSLALKNRYSTIRNKAGGARTASNMKRNPKRLKSDSRQLPKGTKFSQGFSDTNSRGVDEDSQDDDDDDDEEDEEDE